MPDSDIDVRVKPVRIGLLLIDGFALMSYAAFIEPFRAANRLAGRDLFTWRHITLDGREAYASNGAALLSDGRVGDAPEVDLLMVFAAGDPAAIRNDACFAWLRELARRGITVGGVSGGPYLLARAGLLGGRRATIHWEHAFSFRDEFPDISLENSLFVIDGQRITCAGGTAGLDLATKLIEERHGVEIASRVGEWFIRSEPRQAEVQQRLKLADRYGTTHPRLLTALAEMEKNIENPLSCGDIASRAGLSQRQLDRICQAAFDRGLAETYMAIRLDHAEMLLRATTLSVTEVAIACGFRNGSHFSRRFSRHFGLPPSRRKA